MTATSLESVYKRFAATLAKSQFLDDGRLKSYQRDLLIRLLDFSYRNSPFYRDRLAFLFKDEDSPNLSGWLEVPVLRRQELEAQIDRINPKTLPEEAGPVSQRKTSGSTGQNLVFRTCSLETIATQSMMHRFYQWHDIDVSAPLASIRHYGSGEGRYRAGLTGSSWMDFGPGADHYTLDIRQPIQIIADWLASQPAAQLLTFPSLALELSISRYAVQLSGKIRKIIGIGEILTSLDRQIIRKGLGCEMAQIYACGEMGCIALQSPADDRYLVCEETVLVEILDDDDRPVQPGGSGRIVLTSFYNYATPFIRYEIGDRGAFASMPDVNGRSLRVLERIDGRERNHLIGKNGRRISPHDVAASELSALVRPGQFQLRQTIEGDIELDYLVSSDGHVLDAADVQTAIERLLGEPRTIRLRPVSELPRGPGGKRDFILSGQTGRIIPMSVL